MLTDKLINSQTDEHNKEQVKKSRNGMNEEETDQKNIQNIRISETSNVLTESWHFMKTIEKPEAL